jgi:hypothetical protein
VTTRRWQSEGGFALPLTIFVLMLVTVMLAALMVQVQTDRRIADSSGDLVEALVIAQSGLEGYIAHYDSLAFRPSNGDSLRINVVGGYADVIAHVVHAPADTMLGGIDYIIRSRGRLIHPTRGSDPQAIRVVSQFARWEYGTMKVLGAYTAIDGIRCTEGACGGTYELSGYDECLSAPNVPALFSRQGGGPALVPPEVDPREESAAGNAFRDSSFTGIDWRQVVSGAFHPDYKALTNVNDWATYVLDGDVILTDVDGAGLLIIIGNATLSGARFKWQGVLAVGGNILFEAETSTVTGAVVSGLNMVLSPQGAGRALDWGRFGDAGTHIEITYNSCTIRNAFRSLSGFALVPGAWMDRWASY